jgi:hypothetical protein
MTETSWHYQDGDKPAGPVSAAVIREKIREGHIRRGTLLWKEGSPDWVSAEQTEFAQDTDSALNNPYAPSTSASAYEAGGQQPLKPLSAKPAWTIALAPLALIPLAFIPFTGFVGFALYISLSIWDRNQIRESGREPSLAFLWTILLGALGAPIYLFLRAARTDRQWAYGFVSIVTLVVFFAVVFLKTAGSTV